MSSLVEKSETPIRKPTLEKRNFFLRSSSIQKIKCSATYPFRIAGSKLSREAIKQLLESLIVKARLVSQKALIIIYIATLRVIGAISPLSSSILAYDDVCDKLKETGKQLTFIERLLFHLMKLHIHKVEHQRKQGEESEKVIAPAVGSKLEQTPEATPVPESNINKRLLLSERTEPKKRNLMFIGLVFTSATLIYVQFLALVFVLNTAPTPPGLIFMVAGLSFIGYLAFKVFCTNTRGSVQASLTKKEASKTEENKDLNNSTRQSRFRIRGTIDFGGKTLSKIKIL